MWWYWVWWQKWAVPGTLTETLLVAVAAMFDADLMDVEHR